MTAKELIRILKKVGSEVEILVGTAKILKIERVFIPGEKKMQLTIIPK